MTERSGTLHSTHLLLVGDEPWVGAFADALAGTTEASVRTVPTASEALDLFSDHAVDGIVADYRLPDATGVDLVRAVREETATFPVVLCTAAGDESVASDAIAAGVTDYVALDDAVAGLQDSTTDRLDDPLDDGFDDLLDDGFDDLLDDGFDDLLDRTERAVRGARRTGTLRERARQFDAIFHDGRTATWVLDADGSLARVNRTARKSVGVDAERLVGRPFWELPWWSRTTGAAADVRRVVETALEGRFGNAVVLRERGVAVGGDAPAVGAERTAPAGADSAGGIRTGSAADVDSVDPARADAGDPGAIDSVGVGSEVVELSARPVTNERGELVSVVVEGVDITDRVELERDLRRSEELHRVTLNNMTDTVLMTDEDDEYTYVCPNVHFIFGYTAAEIRAMGGIEELLGEDLFDRDALAEAGVLKNIECTATDKAGREHTLLVNVREVSIQDGTLLYSCRDVTKRKQREEALATLQETAREFLYAETDGEIAQHVADDTPGVLDLDAGAVYLFDADDNELLPAARTAGMAELNGPLPTVHADGETLPGYSFVEDESLFLDDVHDDDRLENRATGLRSAAYIPLGNHGVFVAGSADVGAFDAVTRELADLLAATAEAALDRVSRESRLREQDRALQRQNEELSVLNRINETIREIDQAIVRAETREEVDHAVCELLTADDRFEFAWIGDADPPSERVTPRAWAGAEQGYLDSGTFAVAGDAEPAGRTAASLEPTVVSNVAGRLREEAWRKDALSRDYLSVLSVPLVYNELTHGVLTVYAGSRAAFDETVRAVLTELGETAAAAISAIERKNALLSTSMTRVEFAVDDPTFLLSRLAREADCTLSYRGGAQQTAAGSSVFVTVEDAGVDDVAAAAESLVAVESVQRIGADGSGGVLKLDLSGPFLAQGLADHGAVLRRASADPTGTTLVVDVPESGNVRRVTRLVEDAVADVDLRAKQPVDEAATRALPGRFLDSLTDRQLEVVQTAHYSGYFTSPRENSGEDVAAALDVSPTAFYRHVRTVERKLFSTLFDEGSVRIQSEPGRASDGVRY